MYYIQSKQNHNVLHLLLYNYYTSFSFFADLQKKKSKTQCVLNNPFFYPLTQSNTTLRGARNVSCKHEAKNVTHKNVRDFRIMFILLKLSAEQFSREIRLELDRQFSWELLAKFSKKILQISKSDFFALKLQLWTMSHQILRREKNCLMFLKMISLILPCFC